MQSKTTRHHQRRVVWILIFLLTSVFFGYASLQFLFGATGTKYAVPADVTWSLHFEKNTKNTRILSQKIGNQSLNPVLPWTVDDLLLNTKGNFSLYFDDFDLIAVGFSPKQEDISFNIPTTSTILLESDAWMLVSAVDRGTSDVQKRGINRKWWLSQVIQDEKGHVQRFRLTKKGMTFPFALPSETPLGNIALPEQANVIASFQTTSHSLHNDPILTGVLSRIIEPSAPMHIVIAEDEQGISYSALLPPVDLSAEELLEVSRDIIGRRTLTTQALTSNTGELFTELAVDDEHLFSEIRAEEDFAYVSVSNTQGDALRISKTDEAILIANREISSEIGDFSYVSPCLAGAHSFIDHTKLNATFASSTALVPSFEQALFSPFVVSTTASSTRKTRLCW